ncbi:peptidylprolyl isomerase [Achromobacter denitrificans]
MNDAMQAQGGGCGSGNCSCQSPQEPMERMEPAYSSAPAEPADQASINGIRLADANEVLSASELSQRACTELLRQAAINGGLLPSDDPVPQQGAISEAAGAAIEQLLETALQLPELDDEAGRRHYAAHAARYARGERVRARHVLFAVTPGVDLNALRKRAETCLLDVRSNTPEELAMGDSFAKAAATLSNCPSGAEGGNLGWLQPEDCAPEFAKELFGHPEIGVLPRLVHSRFGLHVVEVLEREQGVVPAYEQVRAAVFQRLHQQSFATALSQYLRLLASDAQLVGVDLDAANTPLVQ